LLLAASGGGTRAALYSASVLQGLARLGRLQDVALLSGVSGGSLAIAYFSAFRPDLQSGNPKAWNRMFCSLSAPYIDHVLAGAAEWRIASGMRIGQILAEGFEHRFESDGLKQDRATLGQVANEIGVVFDTAICGSARSGTLESGGRLVFTNLPNDFLDSAANDGWRFDFPFVSVNHPSIDFARAAALSANFPPVFSNAAIDIDGKPGVDYWVTDGGAVENRGIISILLAVRAALNRINRPDGAPAVRLRPVRILLADASAFADTNHGQGRSDRGLGAKFEAARQISNRLVRELLNDINRRYDMLMPRGPDNPDQPVSPYCKGEKKAHPRSGVSVVDLTMPDALRVGGSFGTNWMMPSSVEIGRDTDGASVKLTTEALLRVVDALFLPPEVRASLRFPDVDTDRLWELVDSDPWSTLACEIGPANNRSRRSDETISVAGDCFAADN
jgi:hypothetical protein